MSLAMATMRARMCRDIGPKPSVQAIFPQIDIAMGCMEPIIPNFAFGGHIRKLEEAKKECKSKEVIDAVCSVFGVSVDELISARKQNCVIPARLVCYALCRRLTSLSLPQIGRAIGWRDHTTILYGSNRMAPLISKIEANIERHATPLRWAEMAKNLYFQVFGKNP